MVGRRTTDVVDRIMGRTDKTDSCWIWKGATARRYGYVHVPGRGAVAVHRVMFERVIGPIAAGLTIDHLCRNTLCVNPEHMEAVTLAENLRRAESWRHGAEFQAAKSFCPQLHPYDEANTYVDPTGRRHCRACGRDRMRKRRQRAVVVP